MSSTSRRKSNQESLGDAIDRLLRVYRLKSGLTETILKSDWEHIVGALIAGHTSEIKLRGSKLIIKVNSAALKQELHYQRDDIQRNVNTHLKEELVDQVIVE
jgi:predicted nucleic acid-binding Zn ribbon protein